MTHSEKKRYIKLLKEKGFDEKLIADLIEVKERVIDVEPDFLEEGTKVKLNIKSIMKDPYWKKMRKEYKDFIFANENKIFTVEYDEKYKNNPIVVCLKEDTTNPKWLFSLLNLDIVDDN